MSKHKQKSAKATKAEAAALDSLRRWREASLVRSRYEMGLLAMYAGAADKAVEEATDDLLDKARRISG